MQKTYKLIWWLELFKKWNKWIFDFFFLKKNFFDDMSIYKTHVVKVKVIVSQHCLSELVTLNSKNNKF